MNFLPEILPLHGIYKGSKILKLIDYTSIQNALLIKYCFDDELPKPLKDCFKKKKKVIVSLLVTCLPLKNCIFIHNKNVETYGKNSVKC